MRKFVILIKFQALAITGCLALFAIAGPPALSQEGEADADAAVETTVVEEVDLEEEPTEPAYVAVSADNPEIATLQLELLLNPLTTDELTVEADAWLLLLRQRVQSISELELSIEQENDIIKVRQEALEQLEKAKASNAPKSELDAIERELNKLKAQATAAQADPRFKEIFTEAKTNYAIVTGDDLVAQARSQLSSIEADEARDKATFLITDLETALGSYELAESKLNEPFFSDLRYEKASELVEDRKDRVTRAYKTLENSPLFTPSLANENVQEQIRDQLIAQATVLETSRSNLVTRVQLVLDELEKKGGDIEAYDRYIKAISGLDFDVTDAQGVRIRFMTWLQSEDGGVRLGLGLLKFGGILLAAFIVAPRVGKISDKLLSKVQGISTLFREFAVTMIKRSVLVLGGFLALAALGVNLGPILAVVGGASFVLAFALQSNLGNFASGLMLLISKPFDVGDEVKVAGYWAYVDSISLANTKLKDFAGNIITLPNNTVWGGDIINHTHSDIRKVGLGINVKFTQDVDQLQDIWMAITSAHPKVLKDPAPGIFPYSSTYDYKMWVGLNAWSKTTDFWGVYVDLLKALQRKLDENNIDLAAPVQEIKVDGSSDEAAIAELPILTEASSEVIMS